MIDDRYSSDVMRDPLIPSQQCSLNGNRTVLMFHVRSAAMLFGPVDPSNAAPPVVGGVHMYSLPSRFTPRRRTVLPPPSTSLLPWTCSAFDAGTPAKGSSTGPPVPPVVPLPL